MNYYNLGQAAAQFMISVAVLAGICIGIIAIVRASRRSARPSTTDAYWFAAFALMPGERCGVVWPAANLDGHPMVATITSTGVFALNHYAPQSPPLRMRPEGVAAAAGSPSAVTPGAAEPMVGVSLTPTGQAPVSFWIAQSGAQALVAWATPSL